jgi:2-dehydro-3-deoxyphosphogluconate aldolase/(4S)-4-hydroxy-2-oxoglutarate aldolase
MMKIDDILSLGPVIPVLTIDDVAHARPIAEALVAGGLRALEVTLRTPVALEAIRVMTGVEGAVVGAGTVLSEAELAASLEAGALFVVSPGITQGLAESANRLGVPFLPGVQTASDIMRGLDLGLSRFKFFPAMAAGGIPALKALCAPFRQCRFCPTGGITQATAADWLALDAVACVGGSWVVPPGKPDRQTISTLARRACNLMPVNPPRAANRMSG